MCGFGQRVKFLMHSEDSVFETGHLLFANYINTPSGRFKVPLFITAFLQEHSLAAVPFFIFSFWKWSTWFLCLLEVELNYRNFPARRKAAPTLLWQKGELCKPRLMKWALKDKARSFPWFGDRVCEFIKELTLISIFIKHITPQWLYFS